MLLKKIFTILLFVMLTVGCTNSKGGADSLSFVPEKSVATLVEIGDETRLLSVEFVVVNTSNATIGPFTVQIKGMNKELQKWIEQDFSVIDGEYVLKPNKKHGYGGTVLVKKDASTETLRQIIEAQNSIEAIILNQAGDIIASEWVQTFHIVHEETLESTH